MKETSKEKIPIYTWNAENLAGNKERLQTKYNLDDTHTLQLSNILRVIDNQQLLD